MLRACEQFFSYFSFFEAQLNCKEKCFYLDLPKKESEAFREFPQNNYQISEESKYNIFCIIFRTLVPPLSQRY